MDSEAAHHAYIRPETTSHMDLEPGLSQMQTVQLQKVFFLVHYVCVCLFVSFTLYVLAKVW